VGVGRTPPPLRVLKRSLCWISPTTVLWFEFLCLLQAAASTVQLPRPFPALISLIVAQMF